MGRLPHTQKNWLAKSLALSQLFPLFLKIIYLALCACSLLCGACQIQTYPQWLTVWGMAFDITWEMAYTHMKLHSYRQNLSPIKHVPTTRITTCFLYSSILLLVLPTSPFSREIFQPCFDNPHNIFANKCPSNFSSSDRMQCDLCSEQHQGKNFPKWADE